MGRKWQTLESANKMGICFGEWVILVLSRIHQDLVYFYSLPSPLSYILHYRKWLLYCCYCLISFN